MKFREWNEIAELVGIAAVVGSLIFVGLQMRQAQHIANADQRQTRVTNFIELSDSINTYAEIWSKGKSGQELSEPESVIFRNLLNATEDYFFFASAAASDLGNEFAADATRGDFVGFLFENPGALREWNARNDFRQKYRDVLMPGAEGSFNWPESVRADLRVLN